MSISITFPNEALLESSNYEDAYSFCYIEEVLPDHRRIKKKVLVHNLIHALNESIGSEKKYISLGMLPKNLLDVKFEELDPLTAEIYLYIPEKIRRVMYEETLYEIPFPNMIMKIAVKDEKIDQTSLLCVSKDFTYKKAKKQYARIKRSIILIFHLAMYLIQEIFVGERIVCRIYHQFTMWRLFHLCFLMHRQTVIIMTLIEQRLDTRTYGSYMMNYQGKKSFHMRF